MKHLKDILQIIKNKDFIFFLLNIKNQETLNILKELHVLIFRIFFNIFFFISKNYFKNSLLLNNKLYFRNKSYY